MRPRLVFYLIPEGGDLGDRKISPKYRHHIALIGNVNTDSKLTLLDSMVFVCRSTKNGISAEAIYLDMETIRSARRFAVTSVRVGIALAVFVSAGRAVWRRYGEQKGAWR